MNRPDPGTPPDVTLRSRPGYITQERTYKLITPLFGGGVEPQQPDPVTVVRATEIRGQLRFWWRATRGGQFGGDLKAMKAAEDALWGSAASFDKGGKLQGGPSLVEVALKSWPESVSKGEPRSRYSYVAFPLSEKKRDVYGLGIEFTLAISFPENKQAEIDAALWAWETFGGIGARTRRGFGALELVKADGRALVKSLSSEHRACETWLREHFVQHVVIGQWHEHVPHLSRSMRIVLYTSSDSALDVWRRLFQKLKDFRQDRSGRFGRSRWPEPEAIRHIMGQRLPKHQPTQLIRKFPRSVFGLPIIFEFKDRDERWPDNPNSDPRKTTLQGRSSDRLASPLILRPLACADSRYIGIALVLDGPLMTPGGLALKGAPPAREQVDFQLTLDEAKAIPMLDGQPDTLRAFLDYLERDQKQ